MKIQINKNQNVYFCSDPHYNHKQMVRGVSKWEDISVCRDFDTLEEHDDRLVENINNTVGEGDVLFCLGDWSFGEYRNNINFDRVLEFRERLNVKELHLILGNHDTEIRNSKELRNVFTTVNDYLKLKVSVVSDEKGVKASKYNIILSHYPIRSWEGKEGGNYHLYGHVHNSISNIGKSMDVGFDSSPNFSPFSFEEINSLLSDKDTNIEW